MADGHSTSTDTEEPVDEALKFLVRGFLQGNLVPFLGAGANDPIAGEWDQRSQRLPAGGQLAEYLSNRLLSPNYHSKDLTKVAQSLEVLSGRVPMFAELHTVLNYNYPLPGVHRFLSGLPALLRKAESRRPNLLVITTNYDDLMERALGEAGELYEVLQYIADGPDRGRFNHVDQEGRVHLIRRPNTYVDASLAKSNVVLKLHGTVDRQNQDNDSYVISEDDYIEFLTHSNLSQLLPVNILERINNSGFLFLGYSLTDWNTRVILRRLSTSRKFVHMSWAVQRSASRFDEDLWKRRDVKLLQSDLRTFVPKLEAEYHAIMAKESRIP